MKEKKLAAMLSNLCTLSINPPPHQLTLTKSLDVLQSNYQFLTPALHERICDLSDYIQVHVHVYHMTKTLFFGLLEITMVRVTGCSFSLLGLYNTLFQFRLSSVHYTELSKIYSLANFT